MDATNWHHQKPCIRRNSSLLQSLLLSSVINLSAAAASIASPPLAVLCLGAYFRPEILPGECDIRGILIGGRGRPRVGTRPLELALRAGIFGGL